MKAVVIVLVVIGVFCFLSLLILAFIAGATATTSALDQAISDMEQEAAIREWMAKHEKDNRKSELSDVDKCGRE